jgi:hypothetical protein
VALSISFSPSGAGVQSVTKHNQKMEREKKGGSLDRATNGEIQNKGERVGAFNLILGKHR